MIVLSGVVVSSVVFVVLTIANVLVPLGLETVSVSYGNRLPKLLVRDAKKSIIRKLEESGCPYSVRLLLREYPPNIVTPTHQDSVKNACPIHANFKYVCVLVLSGGGGGGRRGERDRDN